MNRTKRVTTVAASVAGAFLISIVSTNAAAPPTPQGVITFRTFDGDQRPGIRAGTAVPDGTFYPKRMEGPYNGYPGDDPGDDTTVPVDVRDRYNMNLIGYFYPPKTGKIQFAICTDDPGELWISTDDSPANKKMIATESQWNPKRAFGGSWDPSTDPPTATRRNITTTGDPPIPRPENWSPYIQVTQGKPYYIEAIGTEYGGGDNTAVAFRYEGDPDFMDGDLPISGQYLSSIDRATLTGVYVSGFAATLTGFVLTAHDGDGAGAASLDPATVTAQLDGTNVTVNVVHTAPVSTVTYVKTPGFLASLSTHSAKIDFKDTAGTANSITRQFTVPYYLNITADRKVVPDTSKRGFIWRMHQNNVFGTLNWNGRTELQLSGAVTDTNGVPVPNLADPSVAGGADAPAQAPNPAWAPITFEVSTVINFDQAAGSNGAFTPDNQEPGIPSLPQDPTDPASTSDDNIAAEIITYLELPAGFVMMGVNSDDGFRTTVVKGIDLLDTPKFAGEFNGGRGAADTIFSFVVEEAGVYPFRTIYEEGGGGSNIEWFTVKPDGTKVLVNDDANGGVKAYRALSATALPAITRKVEPKPNAAGVALDAQIRVELVDGASPVATNTVSLKVGGTAVSATLTKAAGVTTVTYKPATPFTTKSKYTVDLSYTEGTSVITRTWAFTTLNSDLIAYWDFNDASNPTNATDKVAGIKGTLISPAADSKAAFSAAGLGHTGNATDRALDLGTTGDGQRLDVFGDPTTFFLNAAAVQDQLAVSFWQKLYEVRNSSSFWTGGPGSPPGVDRYFQAHTPWSDSTIYFDTTGCCGAGNQRISKNLMEFPDASADPVAFLTNSWHHFVCQKKGPLKQIYVDGKLFHEEQNVLPLLTDFSVLQIGTFNGGSSTHGLIDDFAVFATTLTPAEVDKLAKGTAPDQLRAGTPTGPKFNPPTLAGGSVTLSWTGTGTLQESPTVTGTWTTAPSQTNPQTVTATGTKFYRLLASP